MTIHLYHHTTTCRCGHSFMHSEAFTVTTDGARRTLEPLRTDPPRPADINIIQTPVKHVFLCIVCASGRNLTEWEERARWADTVRRKNAEAMRPATIRVAASATASKQPLREATLDELA